MSDKKIIGSIVVDIPMFADGADAKTQLSWVVRNFLCSICESYLKGAPRREEAVATARAIVKSANDRGCIEDDECRELIAEVDKIENEIYPGCSLL